MPRVSLEVKTNSYVKSRDIYGILREYATKQIPVRGFNTSLNYVLEVEISADKIAELTARLFETAGIESLKINSESYSFGEKVTADKE